MSPSCLYGDGIAHSYPRVNGGGGRRFTRTRIRNERYTPVCVALVTYQAIGSILTNDEVVHRLTCGAKNDATKNGLNNGHFNWVSKIKKNLICNLSVVPFDTIMK